MFTKLQYYFTEYMLVLEQEQIKQWREFYVLFMCKCLRKLNNDTVRRLEYNLFYLSMQQRDKSTRKMLFSTPHSLPSEFASRVTAMTTSCIKIQCTLNYAYTAKKNIYNTYFIHKISVIIYVSSESYSLCRFILCSL